MRNETVRTASIYVGHLIVIVIGIMVGKDMLDKPFKISHVADFYTSFAIYGTAISLGFFPSRRVGFWVERYRPCLHV